MSLRNDNLVKKPELSCERRALGWRGKQPWRKHFPLSQFFPVAKVPPRWLVEVVSSACAYWECGLETATLHVGFRADL